MSKGSAHLTGVCHLRPHANREAKDLDIKLTTTVPALPSDYYSISFTSLEAGFRTFAVRKMCFVRV